MRPAAVGDFYRLDAVALRFLLALSTAVVLILTACGGRIVVSNQDCVDLWNSSSTTTSVLPADATELWMIGEDEHDDLRYGSCAVGWSTAGSSDCSKIGAPFTHETEEWQNPVATRCTDAVPPSNAELDASGRLRLTGE